MENDVKDTENLEQAKQKQELEKQKQELEKLTQEKEQEIKKKGRKKVYLHFFRNYYFFIHTLFYFKYLHI
ncbi:hypothetical protein VN0390_05410 [Helicobacter pylori]|nr:hypothetical protein VN0390_05410 [Helicobacter pylori]